MLKFRVLRTFRPFGRVEYRQGGEIESERILRPVIAIPAVNGERPTHHIEDKKMVRLRKYRLKTSNSKVFRRFFIRFRETLPVVAALQLEKSRKNERVIHKKNRARRFFTIFDIFKNLFTEPVENALIPDSKGLQGCLEHLHLKHFCYN